MDNREQTRIRKNGTWITSSGNGAERIAACRDIVARSQYAKIDGIMVDLFSASAILAVHDGLTREDLRAKYLAMPIARMAHVAFKLLK
jgi:hypothetical protein